MKREQSEHRTKETRRPSSKSDQERERVWRWVEHGSRKWSENGNHKKKTNTKSKEQPNYNGLNSTKLKNQRIRNNTTQLRPSHTRTHTRSLRWAQLRWVSECSVKRRQLFQTFGTHTHTNEHNANEKKTYERFWFKNQMAKAISKREMAAVNKQFQIESTCQMWIADWCEQACVSETNAHMHARTHAYKSATFDNLIIGSEILRFLHLFYRYIINMYLVFCLSLAAAFSAI